MLIRRTMRPEIVARLFRGQIGRAKHWGRPAAALHRGIDQMQANAVSQRALQVLMLWSLIYSVSNAYR